MNYTNCNKKERLLKQNKLTFGWYIEYFCACKRIVVNCLPPASALYSNLLIKETESAFLNKIFRYDIWTNCKIRWTAKKKWTGTEYTFQGPATSKRHLYKGKRLRWIEIKKSLEGCQQYKPEIIQTEQGHEPQPHIQWYIFYPAFWIIIELRSWIFTRNCLPV